MGYEFNISSPFVLSFTDGQLHPPDWGIPIQQIAKAERQLARFEDARRILNGYYPVNCRRTWTCIDDEHCSARGRHAQSLAEFELTFNPAQMESSAKTEDAIKCIKGYLKEGKDGYWLWEALVEDVQSIVGFFANGKERIAKWYTCGTLRAYYPYIGGKQYWDEIKRDYDYHAQHVLELIRFEYHFTSVERNPTELERERRIAQHFASRLLSDFDRQICDGIFKGKRNAYSFTTVPNASGVYARFREPDDPLPMYVGMGNLKAMEKRHKHYSGDHEIYLTCFEDNNCKITEQKLLSVFDPPENGHRTPRRWIQHPDELPEWFSQS